MPATLGLHAFPSLTRAGSGSGLRSLHLSSIRPTFVGFCLCTGLCTSLPSAPALLHRRNQRDDMQGLSHGLGLPLVPYLVRQPRLPRPVAIKAMRCRIDQTGVATSLCCRGCRIDLQDRTVLSPSCTGRTGTRTAGTSPCRPSCWPAQLSARLPFCCTPPLPLVGVPTGVERECQQNDSLADGYPARPASHRSSRRCSKAGSSGFAGAPAL